MVARLLQVLVHGFARSSRLLPQLAVRDSSRLSDDNNTASEASILGVLRSQSAALSGWCGVLRPKAPERGNLLRLSLIHI